MENDVVSNLVEIKRMETNLYLDATSPEEFTDIIIQHFLPESFIVSDPLPGKQILTLILLEILDDNPHPGVSDFDAWLESLKNRVKRLLGKPVEMPEVRKRLFSAVLAQQGLSVEYSTDRHTLHQIYDTNRHRAFTILDKGQNLKIVVPVFLYLKEPAPNPKTVLTNERFITTAYIYDNEDVTGKDISKLIAMIESNRWKRRI